MNEPIRHSIEEIWNSNFPNWVSVTMPNWDGPGNEGLLPTQDERDRDAGKDYSPLGKVDIHPINNGGVRGAEKLLRVPNICVRSAGGPVPQVPAPIPEVPEVPKTDTDPDTDPDNRGDEPSNKDNESPSDQHDADPPPPEFRPGPVTPRPPAE